MEEMKSIEAERSEHHWLEKIALDGMIGVIGSIFLALLSQISIPLPFTPVPMTLQTFGVFLLGGLLERRRAWMSIAAYLIQGTSGIPVFAGGVSNPLWILDCKAGFLLSFLPAVLCISFLLRKNNKKNIYYIIFCLTIGQMLIFIIGSSWLSFYVGFVKAVQFGIVPFISGAALKILMAAISLKGFAFLKKRRFLCSQ